MLALFKKKCEYCRAKIETDTVIKRNIKVPGYVGTFEKAFCSEAHADAYETELENKQNAGKSCGGCC